DLLTSHSHKIRWLPYPPARGKVGAAACRQTGRICLRYLGNTLVLRSLSHHCTWQTNEGCPARVEPSPASCTSSSTKLVHNLAAILSAVRLCVPRGTNLRHRAC